MNRPTPSTRLRRTLASLALVSATMTVAPVWADSTGPRLAAYYDRFLAICESQVLEWVNDDPPRKTLSDASRVAVGRANRYALTGDGRVLAWKNAVSRRLEILDQGRSLYAGREGVLVIRDDFSLWQLETSNLFGFGEEIRTSAIRLAPDVLAAAVGDGTDYYVTRTGQLMVRGKAHRGQYGDGRLQSSRDFIQTADDVTQVSAHTGHALILKRDGSVWGTGGNIYGPIGRHGHGDKSDRWQLIMRDIASIATGSAHSLAIDRDRQLWTWGRNEGLEPKKVLADTIEAAAGTRASIAISDGWLWQWNTGDSPRRRLACP